MKKALKLFTVAGIGIYLHWTFIFLVVWILFMQAIAGAGMVQTLWAFLAVGAMFACVVLHELGHALVAARYRIRTTDITLLPIGGLAHMERLPDKPRQEIAISIAGPLVNVAIALLTLPFLPTYTLFWKAPIVLGNVDAGNFLFFLHTINVILALFNLIPAFPMDGGRILRGVLGLFMSYTRATTIAAAAGRVMAGIFILAGFLAFNLILPVIGLFIILAGSAEERHLYLKTASKGLRLKDVMTRDYAGLPANMTVQDAAARLLDCHQQHFVVTGEQAPPRILNRSIVMKTLAADRPGVKIGDLADRSTGSLDEESQVAEVVDKLMLKGNAAYPVTSNGRLAGVVNLENVVEYLLVHHIGEK